MSPVFTGQREKGRLFYGGLPSMPALFSTPNLLKGGREQEFAQNT